MSVSDRDPFKVPEGDPRMQGSTPPSPQSQSWEEVFKTRVDFWKNVEAKKAEEATPLGEKRKVTKKTPHPITDVVARASDLVFQVEQAQKVLARSLQSLGSLAPLLFADERSDPRIKEMVIKMLGGAEMANKYAQAKIVELGNLAQKIGLKATAEDVKSFVEVAVALHRSMIHSFTYEIFDITDRGQQFLFVDRFVILCHQVHHLVLDKPKLLEIFRPLQELFLSGKLLEGMNKVALSGMPADKVKFKVNPAAGVNPSEKWSLLEGNTVGLFKPQGPSVGAKAAPCFKQKGSQEIREIVSSLWSELCGGWGNYHLTVGMKVPGSGSGLEQFGSLQAWRSGAVEYAGSVIDQQLKNSSMFGMIEDYLTTKDDGIGEMVGIGRVSLDGREGTANIREMRREVLGREKAMLESFSSYDAQSLMVFHLGSLQLDVENAANVMVAGSNGEVSPFAIDGGLSAPDKLITSDLNSPCWVRWPQADQPWDRHLAAKLASIDVVKQAKIMQEILSQMPVEVNQASINRLKGAMLFLQHACASGMTPNQTFNAISTQLEGWVSVAEKSPDFKSTFQAASETYVERVSPRKG